jgi:putative transposase
MKKTSYAGCRFAPEIIQRAIWLCLQFTVSFRNVEDLLTERGITVSCETTRRQVNHCRVDVRRGFAQTAPRARQRDNIRARAG